MWADLTPIVAKLPKKPANGALNGIHSAREARPGGDWTSAGDDLERYRSYSDDWDGLGAKGISREVIDSAVDLVAALKSRDVIPPHCVLPGFGGTVSFEWDLMNGGTMTLEITGPWTAELEIYIPGQPLEQAMIGETLIA